MDSRVGSWVFKLEAVEWSFGEFSAVSSSKSECDNGEHEDSSDNEGGETKTAGPCLQFSSGIHGVVERTRGSKIFRVWDLRTCEKR